MSNFTSETRPEINAKGCSSRGGQGECSPLWLGVGGAGVCQTFKCVGVLCRQDCPAGGRGEDPEELGLAYRAVLERVTTVVINTVTKAT